jgi:hypothetical protein
LRPFAGNAQMCKLGLANGARPRNVSTHCRDEVSKDKIPADKLKNHNLNNFWTNTLINLINSTIFIISIIRPALKSKSAASHCE